MTTLSLDNDSQPTASEQPVEQRTMRSRQGFTLVEIMAATGIMVAVILLVLGLTTNVLNTWNFSSDQLAQNYEARIALDFINQDMEAAYFNSKGMVWMQAVYGTVGNSDDQARLFFFSPVTDRDSDVAGDYCAVAYATEYQNPFNPTSTDRRRYGLYRRVVDAETTFNDVMTVPNFAAGGTLYDNYWEGNMGTGITGVFAKDNYLSANVADFKVIFWYDDGTRNADGTKDIKAITSNEGATGNPLAFVVADRIYISDSGDGTSGYNDAVDGHLVYADITMTVLGDEGANMVGNDSWDDMGITWEQFLKMYGQTFTRRVYIMSNPL
ncbi:prepilin-type N-terminal cleavage/methylation domain-containing protein [Ruficoccus amylovorans]|uniref:Prepilin-type N-terminal cleavage/methylation domain-containing protein n=1 Tax=Ruficoccus amylovorans TaxID=1804625 RepID=A0A842HFA4_9BACT|nr:prepilin-type N-terminal cleavage/methylation domain-containing protein [Ruficoccus amylovorans]MBC2594316.1 prepilin-type N-terminal cleavage/methylation domain-containing protein [Ruficoccus amylovorans]